MGALCHSRCGTLKNPHCSMDISIKHYIIICNHKWQWFFFYMGEKFSKGTKTTCKHYLWSMITLIYGCLMFESNTYQNMSFYEYYISIHIFHPICTCVIRYFMYQLNIKCIERFAHTFSTHFKTFIQARIYIFNIGPWMCGECKRYY